MEAASGGDGAGLPKPTAATCNAITGLATGRFGARLKNGVVTSQGIVHGKSDLSAADKAALARLPADGRYFTMNLEFPPRGLPADGGPRPRRRRAHHGLPLAEMDLTLHRVELAELIAFLAVLLLAGFAGTGFVRRSLRPLRQVAATATRVTELPLASGSVTLTERVPNANPRTGVCQSNAAFNRLLQHVEGGPARRAASEARLRRLAADASHELRTPLSAIPGLRGAWPPPPGPPFPPKSSAL